MNMKVKRKTLLNSSLSSQNFVRFMKKVSTFQSPINSTRNNFDRSMPFLKFLPTRNFRTLATLDKFKFIKLKKRKKFIRISIFNTSSNLVHDRLERKGGEKFIYSNRSISGYRIVKGRSKLSAISIELNSIQLNKL